MPAPKNLLRAGPKTALLSAGSSPHLKLPVHHTHTKCVPARPDGQHRHYRSVLSAERSPDGLFAALVYLYL